MTRNRNRQQTGEGPARRSDVERLTDALGVAIDPELLVLALTHRSFAHEAGGLPTNERLEFLGDSVLGVIVTEHLYRTHSDVPEGDLARMRAATVSQKALAVVARELDLGDYVLLGRGERTSGGREKDSILSDAVEAIIGAVYLGHGLEPTREVVTRLVGPMLEHASSLGAALDWKSSLQEAAAAKGLPAPTYEISHEGPDHAKVFTAVVTFSGEVAGTGAGSSKKVAEAEAAEAAYAWVTGPSEASDGVGQEGSSNDETPNDEVPDDETPDASPSAAPAGDAGPAGTTA
ncbi:ribonuclease III [Georgenia sp. Z1344]|uniref:ribonuclease III n=1 Tax=Georgenia sp. Z1344 TaxID=3416706 RepID=UPI003CF3C87F